jgi:hypothetical protein
MINRPLQQTPSIARPPQLTLYDALKIGYKDNETQQGKDMSKYGYQIDKALSNDNQQVYYDPNNKKLLMNITGSHNVSDWVNSDVKLGLGKILKPLEYLRPITKPLGLENIFGDFKQTNRFRSAEDTLRKAKSKYDENQTTITGHSLGSRIAQDIARKGDTVYGLNPGNTLFQPTKANQNVYRTSGDLVSIAGSGSKNIRTLANPTKQTGNLLVDVYNAHNIDTIRDQKIFV